MGVTILLVDDDSGVNFLNKFLLNVAKVASSIRIAVNGREAMDMLVQSPPCPDIIFLDLNMPVMDGFEFLEHFKKHGDCYNHTQVYILSSSIRDADRIRAAEFSCVAGYLEKPLSEDTIKTIFQAQ
jgi:CheY-like chemotaxis protein